MPFQAELYGHFYRKDCSKSIFVELPCPAAKLLWCPSVVHRVSLLYKLLFFYTFFREKMKNNKPSISLMVTVKS